MAAAGPLLPRANATWCAVDGALTFVAADDPVELAKRRDRVAKRARDADSLREEADARGWSSALPERSLVLRRRRRGSAPSSFSCGGVGGTTVVPAVPKEEQSSSREVAPIVEVASVEDYFYLAVL